MKLVYLSAILLFSLKVNAQTAATVVSSDQKISDASIISVTKYDANNKTAESEKPKMVTAEDKKLWTRPVYMNPNYLKAMPLKDPNEVEQVDNE